MYILFPQARNVRLNHINQPSHPSRTNYTPTSLPVCGIEHEESGITGWGIGMRLVLGREHGGASSASSVVRV